MVNIGNVADDLSGPALATGQDHERFVNHLDYAPLAPPQEGLPVQPSGLESDLKEGERVI